MAAPNAHTHLHLPMSAAPSSSSLSTTAWAVSLCLALSGCSALGSLFGDDKVDYKSGGAKVKPLEVPPDLSQIAREGRYPTQTGVVSAAGAANRTPGGPTSAPNVSGTPAAAVAAMTLKDMRIERDGQHRWLVVPQAPEIVWPQLRQFWETQGFQLPNDNPATGVMETNWSENRAKLPHDAVRNVLGRLVRNLYDTGERDLFRTRVERSGGSSEIYISHRGVEEVASGPLRDQFSWRTRPNDAQLEAEMLSRLMVTLANPAAATVGTPAAGVVGGSAASAPASATSAALAAAAATPAGPARARALGTAGASQLELDEAFDRAWRRVGLVLDRGGFTVEDRDRASGLYYVRYVDPKTAGQEEPGFFSRLFGTAGTDHLPVRYRLKLAAQGAQQTVISVTASDGTADTSDNARRIVAQLIQDLR